MVNSVEINKVGILHLWPGADRASEEKQTVTFSPKHPGFQCTLMDALKGVVLVTSLQCTGFYERFRYRFRHLQLTDVARFGEVDNRLNQQ